MDSGPQLGQLIGDGDRQRDAIHVAVASVTAAERLVPGQRVGLVRPGSFEWVGPCADPIGIVDPFLNEAVQVGHRFWLLLFPGTITGLRHIWKHPAFTNTAIAARKEIS